MKVKMYIDLPDDNICDIDNGYFLSATNRPSFQKIQGHSRYAFEVDLPIHHFKPIADRQVEAITLGKEED